MKKNTRILTWILGLSLACPIGMLAQTPYPINFETSQEYTRSDRHLDAVSLNGSSDGSQTLQIAEPRRVYTALLDKCFTARAGETLTASFGYSGTWMHGYVYLDQGNDGSFEATLGANAQIPAGSDIMAFSCAPYDESHYNSAGESVSNLNVLNPPSFRLPENLRPGYYRMRFKVDWDYIDPAGCMNEGNSILQNGGAILDVRLNIHGDYCLVTASQQNGKITASDGTSIEQAPFGKALQIKVLPDDGYFCDGIKIRHGYGLDGDSLVHGTPQYVDAVYPGYLIRDGKFTIPGEMMDGDVRIEGIFVKASGEAADKGYDLNFDPAQIIDHENRDLKNFRFSPSKGKARTISLSSENTLYRNLLNKEASAVRGSDITVTPSYQGDQMHFYFYIDLNQDGSFTPNLTESGRPALSSELVSYTHYNGRNSLGEQTHAENSSYTLPACHLPEELPVGVYRARLKMDWNSIDPAGSAEAGQSIVDNGGCVIDFLLNVHEEQHTLELVTSNGNIYAPNNEALPLGITPFESVRIVPTPIADGYKAQSVRIRHGHNFEGPQYINGNRQWSEFTAPARSYSLSPDSINGDVVIYADFEPTEKAAYRLVFQDEFDAPDGSQPDSGKWMRCQRQGATWNRWLSDSEEVIYLEDGKLVARAIPNPDQSADPVPMITGGIKSMGKFGFTYGLVECRALNNPWIGNFPAIWMMPEDQSAGWPDCGEIDIWEVIDAQETSFHTIHSNWTYDLGNKNNPQSSFNTPVKLDRYHTYGLEWNENSLTWYVDGKFVGSYRRSYDDSQLEQGQWPFDKHFHLILNQSVGNGSWAANADVSHVYETRFDWIRVYQKEGQENTDGTVGINSAERESSLSIRPLPGGVHLSSDRPTQVNVFDLSGRCLYQIQTEGSTQLPLTQGIYLVNGKKILVR